MKTRMKFIIPVLIMLCSIFRVSASTGEYLVKFRSGFSPDLAEYNLKVVNAGRGIYLTDNPDSLKPIDSYIEYTSENSIVPFNGGEAPIVPFSLAEDELYPEQWQLQLIKADTGWELEAYGNDIKVAVIDSGCYAHEDLKDNLLKGKNYLTGSAIVKDNVGHGTHVSGVIAAAMNDTGTVGVAPKAKIVPLKCFDPSYTTKVEHLVAAIYDAVDVYGCRIINMSWGWSKDDESLKDAIDYASDKGVILIASVGNDGEESLCYPAAYENVIGVGSVGAKKNLSYFSQYNESVTIVASGEKVKSTFNNGSYDVLQGTSQAAPMISGIAATMLSMKEDMTSTEFKKLLTETAEDLGDAGYDVKFGYGLADEDAMVNRLMQDIDYYVSPINSADDKTYVLIKNNTGTLLEASSIFSEFAGNRLSGSVITPIKLQPGEATEAKTQNSSNKILHFLWNGQDKLKPLAKRRETQ